MNISSKGRRIILISAVCVLVLCVVWSFTRGRNSERSRICDFLADYGYNVYEDDLLFAYDNDNTTIKNALGKTSDELSEVIAASKAGGFDSDVELCGGVTLILATDGSDTVYMYMLEGMFELCFIQDADGNIKPLAK